MKQDEVCEVWQGHEKARALQPHQISMQQCIRMPYALCMIRVQHFPLCPHDFRSPTCQVAFSWRVSNSRRRFARPSLPRYAKIIGSLRLLITYSVRTKLAEKPTPTPSPFIQAYTSFAHQTLSNVKFISIYIALSLQLSPSLSVYTALCTHTHIYICYNNNYMSMFPSIHLSIWRWLAPSLLEVAFIPARIAHFHHNASVDAEASQETMVSTNRSNSKDYIHINITSCFL